MRLTQGMLAMAAVPLSNSTIVNLHVAQGAAARGDLCTRVLPSLRGIQGALSLTAGPVGPQRTRPAQQHAAGTPSPLSLTPLRRGHWGLSGSNLAVATAAPPAAPPSPAAASGKSKDMYADLARYGIMDEFDMAPTPFYPSTSATPTLPPPGSAAAPTAPPAPGTGSPRTGLGVGYREDLILGQPGGGRAGGVDGSTGAGRAGGSGFAEEGRGSGAAGSSEDAGPGTWCVYLLLASDEKKTYVGVTNDVDRR